MDSHMLFGCSGFVLASFASYALAVWPFFIWMDVHAAVSLGIALAAGVPVAFLFGCVSTWKLGIAGAAGFVGGMVASAIFLYLRFEQVFLEADAQRIPPPDYPTSFQWLLPGVTVLFALLLATAVSLLLPNRADAHNLG